MNTPGEPSEKRTEAPGAAKESVIPQPAPEPESRLVSSPTAFLQTESAFDIVLPQFPAEAPPTPPAEGAAGVKKAVVSSAVWTMSGFGTMQVLRMVSMVVLYRLLAPEVFGIMALVNIFIQGLHMFTDIGIGSSIVQNPRGEDRDFLNTAWTLQVARGLSLWLCSCALAWPVARIYGKEELLWLIPVAALTAAMNGFNSTSIFTLERRLSQSRLVLRQVGTYLVSICVTIAFVLLVQRSVWALVVGSLVGSLMEVAFSHMLIPGYRNRFRWDRQAVHDLVHFGKWIFVGTLGTFVADQADRLIVGKVGDLEESAGERIDSLGTLGIYNIAVQLALVPKNLMYALVPKVVFPVYSRMHQQGRNIRDVFIRTHLAAGWFEAFMIAGLIGTGPALVRCLFRQNFHDAGWMLQLLAVGAWFTMLEATAGSLLWAMGHSRTSAISNMAKAVALPVLALAGYKLWGFKGLILGFVAADFVRYANTAWALHRYHGLPIFTLDACLSLIIAAVSGGTIASSAFLDHVVVDWLPPWFTGETVFKWVHLVVETLDVVLAFSILLLIGWKKGLFRGLRG